MQNDKKWAFWMISDHFGGEILEKVQPKLGILNHFRPLWYEMIVKVQNGQSWAF